MRDGFDRLLHELTLVTLALAIATGWSLIQVVTGVATLVGGLLHEPVGMGLSRHERMFHACAGV